MMKGRILFEFGEEKLLGLCEYLKNGGNDVGVQTKGSWNEIERENEQLREELKIAREGNERGKKRFEEISVRVMNLEKM